MRKLSFLVLVGTLALVTGGCGGSAPEGGNQTTSPPPATTAPATPTTAPPQSFKDPVVPGSKPETDKANATDTAVAPPDLIPPTNPKDRLSGSGVKVGGKDPFAQPEIQLEPSPFALDRTQQPVGRVRRIPGTEGTPPVRVPTTAPGRTLSDGTSASGGQAAKRTLPQVPGVPVPRPPVVVIRSTPTLRRVPLAFPRTAQPSAIARAPQPVRTTRPSAIARTPQPTRTTRPSAIARTPQPVRTTRPGAIARAPQPTRTAQRNAIARTPQRRPASRTTTAARPATPNRPNVNQPSPATSTVPPTPQIATLPPPPEPTLARAVEVSGVVQVGNEPQAIIKAPNEATSRYVRVGQRLSNGQVLVKRIEMNEGSEPVVILEQNGIEVAKMIGERPVAPAQPGAQPTAQPTTPTASIPTFSKQSASHPS